MHNKLAKVLLIVLVAVNLVGCGNTAVLNENADIIVENTEEISNEKDTEQEMAETVNTERTELSVDAQTNEILAEKYSASIITLSDEEVLWNGKLVSADNTEAVYAENDIVFYLEGQDFTYGEGTKEDEHSQEEADLHTVVHITQPGNYVISGKLSAGQIAVDLGEDAKEDENAVVNLILNNVDITCSVAPGVIFYNVYECGSEEEETAQKDVDTGKAGANVIIADGSVNTINGSYVARIYKSVELNEEGTEVVDSKKLHKYDGAFYSKMSMNVNGEENNSGILTILAENEGLDSEFHLTINGGTININSGNDGINTNEDGISVTTINGGNLNIVVNGSTGEGDGIDSNGWLVINGGIVTASACGTSGDAGIDSDMGIHINGGTIAATGNMLDQIAESNQNYVVFSFASTVEGGSVITLKNDEGKKISEYQPVNQCMYLIMSSENLAEGSYTLWNGEEQLSGLKIENGMMGKGRPMAGGMKPEGMEESAGEWSEMPEGMEESAGERPEMPEGMEKPAGERPEMPEGMEKPDGEWPEMPEGMEEPAGEWPEMPEGIEMPDGEDLKRPEGGRGIGNLPDGAMENGEITTEFRITEGGNMFMVSKQ